MDDWKLKARSVVKLERTPNMFVSLFLSCFGSVGINGGGCGYGMAACL